MDWIKIIFSIINVYKIYPIEYYNVYYYYVRIHNEMIIISSHEHGFNIIDIISLVQLIRLCFAKIDYMPKKKLHKYQFN